MEGGKKVSCVYCDCKNEGVHMLNGWAYCAIHYEKLSQVKVTNRKLGHVSRYEGELDEENEWVE